MDIHKPKAAHSWREFLIEIGTITCGILIALGLEQVIERIHSHHEAESLDEALRLEVTRDLGESLQQAAFIYCVRAQTATAIHLINESEEWPGAVEPHVGMDPAVFGEKVFAVLPGADARTIPADNAGPTPGFLNAAASAILIPMPRSTLLSQTWKAAVASPGLLHMDRHRRDRYSVIYYHIDQIEAVIADSWLARQDLAALASPQKLTPPERRHYIATLARIDADNRILSALTGLLLAFAAKNDIRPDARDVAERLESRKALWGGCMRSYVAPPYSADWANKLEADGERIGERRP